MSAETGEKGFRKSCDVQECAENIGEPQKSLLHNNTTPSKKPVLPLGCLRMIMSGYSVLEKLAKCRQVTLFACSLLPSSSIAIQLCQEFFGINLSTTSVMIYCSGLQIFSPTVISLGMKFMIMGFTVATYWSHPSQLGIIAFKFSRHARDCTWTTPQSSSGV